MQNITSYLLSVIANDIVPLTRLGVEKGDKVFGAAVLRRDERRLVCAATNRENSGGAPLWHGEMATLADYFTIHQKPPPADCLLLSTHEPCPMCAAAIAWSGISEVYFLFDYDDTEKTFAIPHDKNILAQLFPPAKKLAHDNTFFRVRNLRHMAIGEPALLQKITALEEEYARLSARYQSTKENTDIPLK